jgi:hypothetical protein
MQKETTAVLPTPNPSQEGIVGKASGLQTSLLEGQGASKLPSWEGQGVGHASPSQAGCVYTAAQSGRGTSNPPTPSPFLGEGVGG